VTRPFTPAELAAIRERYAGLVDASEFESARLVATVDRLQREIDADATLVSYNQEAAIKAHADYEWATAALRREREAHEATRVELAAVRATNLALGAHVQQYDAAMRELRPLAEAWRDERECVGLCRRVCELVGVEPDPSSDAMVKALEEWMP
jgi:hypothetical protein